MDEIFRIANQLAANGQPPQHRTGQSTSAPARTDGDPDHRHPALEAGSGSV